MRPKKLDRTRLRRTIWVDARRITGTQDDDDACVAAAFLLASAIVGPDENAVSDLLGEPLDARLEQFAAQARRNGIWTAEGKVAGQEWFEDGGGAALLLHVLCLQGLVEHTSAA